MSLRNDAHKYVGEGISVSKNVFENACKALNKLADDSVLRIEKRNMQKQIYKETMALGLDVLKAFIDDGRSSVESSDPDVSSHIERIKELREEIAKRDSV